MFRSQHILSPLLRSVIAARPVAASTQSLAASTRSLPLVSRPAVRFMSAHVQESFEAFSERYVAFFTDAEDLFEVQRGLNNCFAHDLVPSPAVIEAALRAARRVDDYATAVRIFDGIKAKVENTQQYEAYLEELKGVREELGVNTPEELYPEPA